MAKINDLPLLSNPTEDMYCLVGKDDLKKVPWSAIMGQIGAPYIATTVAGMTDKTRVYVYQGSESGYTSGNWYYWNGSAWTSGGTYNSAAVNTDKTLTQSDKAADSAIVGKEIGSLKEDLGDITQIDKSSNILEISDYTEGRYYSASSGDYRYNNDFSTVDNYVEVEPSCSYVLSEFIDGVFETLISTIIIFYDKNKKFLSGGQYSTFITPEDAKYIRLSLKKDLIGKQLLVEKGTEPTKIWVPYYKRLHLKGGRIIDLSYGV